MNTEEEREIAQHFQIRSIPTPMIFREKVIIFNQPGAMPEGSFRELVQKAGELDMAEVHKQIQAENSTAWKRKSQCFQSPVLNSRRSRLFILRLNASVID